MIKNSQNSPHEPGAGAPPRTQAAVRPGIEYAKDMGAAADLRVGMAHEMILRKWRTSSERIEWLRDEMSKGRFGGWLPA